MSSHKQSTLDQVDGILDGLFSQGYTVEAVGGHPGRMERAPYEVGGKDTFEITIRLEKPKAPAPLCGICGQHPVPDPTLACSGCGTVQVVFSDHHPMR